MKEPFKCNWPYIFSGAEQFVDTKAQFKSGNSNSYSILPNLSLQSLNLIKVNPLA